MKLTKVIKWLLQSIVIGIGLLLLMNIIGVYLHISIPLNIFTIAIVGILRLPGLILLLIYFLL